MNSNRSYSPNSLVTGALEIWRMTLKKNRAPLLCYFKLCVSFLDSGEFRLELQPRNSKIKSKLAIFVPWKTKDTFSYATSSFRQHFIAVCEFKIAATARKRLNWPQRPWPLTLIFCVDITFANINHSWTINTMTGTLSKMCDKRTDRRMGGRNHSQNSLVAVKNF